MVVTTHCLPTGSLGTNEISVCNVSASTTTVQIPAGGLGNGNVRGIFVAMHGLSVVNVVIPPTIVTGNDTIAQFQNSGLDFANNLLADGWMVLTVPYPEDFSGGLGCVALWNDLNSDSGHGSRYLAMTMHWWDHVVDFIQENYGENIPIVPFGGSWGGYHTIQVAINRQSTIVAYCPVVPATLLSYVNPAFTNPSNYGPNQVVSGATYNTPLSGGTAGLDIPSNALNPNITSSIGVTNINGVTVPGGIHYGTNDNAAGWQNTASLPGAQPINSNLDAMITSAASAGLPATRLQTSNFHQFTNDDAGYSAVFTPTGPTALSSLSTLQLLSPNNGGSLGSLVSGHCAILASDNLWHTITFTNFTLITYTTTSVTNVATSLPSTLTLNSVSGLPKTSGAISVSATGTELFATFSGVSGNNLTGVTYVSGTGNIVGGSTSVVTYVIYVTTSVPNVNSGFPSTLGLSSTVGLDTTGGKMYVNTNNIFFPIQIQYTGISGNNLTGVSVVSNNGGTISGTAINTATMQTSLIGCTYSGNTSATVSANSPVSWTGIPITGGFMNMSSRIGSRKTLTLFALENSSRVNKYLI